MCTIMGSLASSGSVVTSSDDHGLEKASKFLPEMPLKMSRYLKMLPWHFHNSNILKICSRSKSYLKNTKVLYESKKQMTLEGTRRSALFLGFTSAVCQVLSVNFCGPQFMDWQAKANESTFPLDGPGSAGAEIVLQGAPFTTRLSRPRMGLTKSKEELEEVLTVKLKLLRGKASTFHVFINLPDANEQTMVTCVEYAGTYFHEPRIVRRPEFEYQELNFRIGIGDILKDLGLSNQSDILVTFVPRGVDKQLPVVFKRVYIDIE